MIVQLLLKHAGSGPDPGSYGFRVLSGGAGQMFTTTGAPAELPDFPWPANDTPGTRLLIPSLGGVPKGIPIAAGSRMGMVRIGGTSNQGVQIWSNSSGGTLRQTNSVHNSGSLFYFQGLPDEVMLQYQIEPDADGDGFGDETQDRCPTNAAIQSACPVPAATPVKKCKKGKRKKGGRSAGVVKKKKGCKRKRKKKK